MPTPLEFMERVIPWPGPTGPGYVNLHWTKDKKWRGKPYKTAAEFIEMAQWLAPKPAVGDDIYYCMTVQSDTTTTTNGKVVALRNAGNATLVKALWLDVDVKTPPKGYATIEEALDAISRFCADAHLPNPSAFVFSGGGVHVYWISNVPLTIAEWRPYAEGLKAEAMRLGLRADYGVTADPARVLRVPGTFNRKIPGQPRAVKVVGLGCDYEFETDLVGLRALGQTKIVTEPVTGKPASPFDLTAFKGYDLAKVSPELAATLNQCTDKLSDGLNIHSDLPLKLDEVIKNCGHFRDAGTNKGAGHGQGLWMLTVLASTWLEGGREWAHQFSKGYPTYSADETDAMYDRKLAERASGKLGWPSCKSFENEGCKQCSGCPLKGRINSPLNLAERVAPPPELSPAAALPAVPPALKLPDEYVLNANGIICLSYLDEKSGKTFYLPLFQGTLAAPYVFDKQGDGVFAFDYYIGPNYKHVEIKFDDWATDQTLARALAKAGVMTVTANEKHVRGFMKSWVARIREAAKAITSAPYGWVYHDDGNIKGFAYGGKLFLTQGGSEVAGHPDSKLEAKYSPTGSVDTILEMLRIQYQENRPSLEVLTLQALTAPLMAIGPKLFATVVWCYSNQSGARKSTALMTGMAFWSSPNKTKENFLTSVAGFEVKMGQLKNLPLYFDELKHQKDVALVDPLIHLATEAHSGSKSTRARTTADGKDWQTTICCGSNQSMRAHMIAANGNTDAGVQRVFEYQVPRLESTAAMGFKIDTLTSDLSRNFGHLGLRAAEYMATHVLEIEKRCEQVNEMVAVAVGGQSGKDYEGQERFWKGVVVGTMVAAEIGNKIIGETVFHEKGIWDFLVASYLEQRDWARRNVKIGGEKFNIAAVVNAYFDRTINNTLVTKDWYSGGRNGPPKKLLVWRSPPKGMSDFRHPVMVHWSVEGRMVRFFYEPLSAWIKENYKDDSPSAVIENIAKVYGGTIKSRVDLTAGLSGDLVVPKVKDRVLDIPIPIGHDFEDILEKMTPGNIPIRDVGPVAMPPLAGAPAQAMGATGAA